MNRSASRKGDAFTKAKPTKRISRRKTAKRNNNDMKVTKHYEQNHVILYVTEGDLQTTITLDSDRQMKRLADCLSDLYRTDGREVTITPNKQ